MAYSGHETTLAVGAYAGQAGGDGEECTFMGTESGCFPPTKGVTVVGPKLCPMNPVPYGVYMNNLILEGENGVYMDLASELTDIRLMLAEL